MNIYWVINYYLRIDLLKNPKKPQISQTIQINQSQHKQKQNKESWLGLEMLSIISET